MKKISAFISALLLCALCGTSALGAGAADINVTAKTDGAEITYTLVLSECEPVSGFEITVSFDSARLTPKSVTGGELTGGGMFLHNIKNAASTGEMKVAWASAGSTSGGGELFTVVFTASETLKSPPKLTVSGILSGESLEDVEFSVSGLAVKKEEKTPAPTGGGSSGGTGSSGTGAKPEKAPETVFSDVPEGAYFAPAVKWAVGNGITNGTGENVFSPDNGCTRAQTVTFLWRAMGSPEPENTVCTFTDVDMSAYYGKAVLWAVENGITNGTGENSFSPGGTVTRGQTVTFLYRCAGASGMSGKTDFSDVPENAYYAPAVSWAVGRGITNGTGENAFSPDASCTRGQIVTFLYRMLSDK